MRLKTVLCMAAFFVFVLAACQKKDRIVSEEPRGKEAPAIVSAGETAEETPSDDGAASSSPQTEKEELPIVDERDSEKGGALTEDAYPEGASEEKTEASREKKESSGKIKNDGGKKETDSEAGDGGPGRDKEEKPSEKEENETGMMTDF